ncbi:MAG: quinolinate synthase NadA [Candidatus Bathyarchaeota archaeon]|nr:MAG: quinolinate synthase NadA [Candidatus Bathyarchaeota archaeon]
MNKEQTKLAEKILKLKKEKKALLLAHNYQRPEIQETADYVADSIGLCRRAQQEEETRLLVFSTVDFMAESAVILNPDKKVLIPDKNALCPMAAMLPAEDVKLARRKHRDAAVVLYVNTLAEAKAMCDVCCTSANAVQVVNSLDAKQVIFGPDCNLAWHIQQHTDKEIIPIPKRGFCYVHKLFSEGDILFAREKHPNAEVLAHPECNPEVQRLADFVGSTSQMYRHVKETPKKELIIATEIGLIDLLKRELPGKKYIPAYPEAVCSTMKLNTLEKIYLALKNEEPVVTVPKPIMKKARRAVEKMTEITGR